MLHENPEYRTRLSDLWPWGDWTAAKTGEGARDIEISVVGDETDNNGLCANQAERYAHTRLLKTKQGRD